MNILETARLVLRRLTVEDAGFILELLNDPDFLRFIGDKHVRTLDDARHYILDGPIQSYERFGFGMFLTELSESAVPIGICGLLKRDSLEDVDIGFAFLPQFRGQGYGFESATATMTYGRDAIGLKRIVAITSPDNLASIALLENLGMKFERLIRLEAEAPEVRLFAADL